MENIKKDYTQIPGWGTDADPKNEPTYPIKKYTGDDHQRLAWVRPPQQSINVEVLHSNERPNYSAVVGTSVPPSGLSGMIRRFAFRYSESSYAHWLPLLLADRINVAEGIIDDLKRGHFPNIPAEKGWKAEWEHNKKGVIKKMVIGAIIATVVIAYISRDGKKAAKQKSK